jgi:hypothetical protein
VTDELDAILGKVKKPSKYLSMIEKLFDSFKGTYFLSFSASHDIASVSTEPITTVAENLLEKLFPLSYDETLLSGDAIVIITNGRVSCALEFSPFRLSFQVYKLGATQETVDFHFLNSFEAARSLPLLSKIESLKYNADADEITR